MRIFFLFFKNRFASITGMCKSGSGAQVCVCPWVCVREGTYPSLVCAVCL